MTEVKPNVALLKDPRTLTVLLEGTEWPVPKLAPKQNEIVVPLILRTLPKILKITGRSGPSEGQEARDAMRISLSQLSEALDEQGMRDLATVLYWALERGHPELTRAAFDDMAIGTLDMVEALSVVARQTGVMRQTTQKEARESAASGEAAAA